jgi:hypothetical protein
MGQCGWVNYNASGMETQKSLPSMKVMLAYQENGKKIESGKISAETGRITGTGPLRLIVPQFEISPPDLPRGADGSCEDKVAPKYRFHENYDHNGGRSSFSIIGIRINPLPKGTRDYGWQSIRDQLIADEKIVIFGALKTKNAR